MSLIELLDRFAAAVVAKVEDGSMEEAVEFIDRFEQDAAELPAPVKEKLRRGMFQILK